MQKAWERPPQFTDPDDCMENVYLELTSDEALPELVNMINDGIPLDEIAQVVLYRGYTQGLWNPDLMLLLIEPTIYLLIAIADYADIKDYVLYEGEEDDSDTVIQDDNITPIPTKLQSMHNKTHTGGVRDKQVGLVDEFAAQINEAVDGIEDLYKEKQTLEAVTKLGRSDSKAVKRLQAEFLRLLYGENGKELEAVKMAIGTNQYTFEDKVREIEADLLKRFDSIVAEPPIKPLGESVRAALELRNQVKDNRDLLFC